MFLQCPFDVIYQTRGRLFHQIQTLRSGLKKRGAASFNQLQSVWISNETRFQVFDIMYRCIPIFNKLSVSNNFILFGSRSVEYN